MPDTPFRLTRVHGLARIELRGDLDCYTAPVLQERLFSLIESGDADLILILNAVDYVDSVALATLVTIHKHTLAHGGSLRVLCANRQVWRVFEITGLQRAFPVYRDEIAFAASLYGK